MYRQPSGVQTDNRCTDRQQVYRQTTGAQTGMRYTDILMQNIIQLRPEQTDTRITDRYQLYRLIPLPDRYGPTPGIPTDIRYTNSHLVNGRHSLTTLYS